MFALSHLLCNVSKQSPVLIECLRGHRPRNRDELKQPLGQLIEVRYALPVESIPRLSSGFLQPVKVRLGNFTITILDALLPAVFGRPFGKSADMYGWGFYCALNVRLVKCSKRA